MVMWPKYGDSTISIREAIITLILWGFDQKNHFYEGVVLAQVKYLDLALGMALKPCTSTIKVLKLKVTKFWELIPMFVFLQGKNW